jgi:hypothetical protein
MSLRTSLPVLAGVLALPMALPAQGSYSAQSFEAPTFRLGQLAGDNMWNGQDGWLVTGDGNANPAAIQLQSQVVRSGVQAGAWDANQFGTGTYAHLRRNAQLGGQGFIEIEMDLQLGAGARPSTSWGLQMQLFPSPASVHVWWEVRSDGSVWYTRGTFGIGLQWVPTQAVLLRGVWHHLRTIVDVNNNNTELWLDGVPVFTGVPPIASAAFPGHGFTSLICSGPGDDTLFFDNFTVRDRGHIPALSVDLPQVRAGAPAQVDFRLAAGRSLGGLGYVILGSASGTSPGLTIAPGAQLPLNLDAFLLTVASNLNSPLFLGFAGQLSPDGTATARLATGVPLPVELVGRTLHFAYATFFPLGNPSEAAGVQILR